MIRRLLTIFLSGMTLFSASVPAEPIAVAVAANFRTTLQQLSQHFEAEQGDKVRISSASTGILYAQIRRGAPFDLLLAADQQRPQRLEQEGESVAGSRFTYALGRLALWIPAAPSKVSAQSLGSVARLAIANPKTAPYGLAAQETLSNLGVTPPRLVQGTNIAQTYQFVASGNAEAGLVALAQLKQANAAPDSYWIVPATLHQPIQQQALLLKRAGDNAAAQRFYHFLRSDNAAALITQAGYDLPDAARRQASGHD